MELFHNKRKRSGVRWRERALAVWQPCLAAGVSGGGVALAGTGATAAAGGVALRRPQRPDHDLFLHAFEKPTQIYRFLRTRNMLSPIFLNRTLSYMKQRMSRSHKSREGFKVDSILDRIMLKSKSETHPNCTGSYMTLTFLGYHDKSLDITEDYQVKVETLLVKICHKRRKDSSSACVEVSVGSASVPLNPSQTEPPAMASAVSISSEAFSPSQGPNVKSYMLLLRVNVKKVQNANSKNNELTNGENEEPPHKRHKTEEDCKYLGCELIVYDKHNRCILNGGEYELVLHDAPPSVPPVIRSPHKALAAHWETIPEVCNIPEDENPFNIFNVRPTLKLRLSWSQEPSNGLVSRPRPLQQRIEKNEESKTDIKNSNKENNKPAVENSKMKNLNSKNKEQKSNSKGDANQKTQIIYQFLYNNNSRQQTEASEDLHCPWCSLDCGRLYALLKHLKLCHSRFSFSYYQISRGARIDVSINELYDASYSGSPHEACAPRGSGRKGGPMRRTPLTDILVCYPFNRKPQRTNTNNLAEFESDDNELTDGQRSYITGHNRLYHHTITCLPIHPQELEMDSEEETDPLWLQQKTMMMIDEFTDVNEGEKELMKMWNLHVMKYNFVGDCQIPIALQMFLQLRGKEILEKNLYRNFVLHMCSLHDFGLITSIVLHQTMQILMQMLSENTDAKQKMRENILLQRENWAAIGVNQQTLIIDQKPAQSTSKPLNFGGESTPSVRRKTPSTQSSNRSVSANYSSPSSTPNTNDTKKKADNSVSSSNGSFEIPQRRKSVHSTANSIGNGKSSGNTSAPEMPLRRKSAGNNVGGAVVANQTRKRLSLQDRKNSA